MDRSSYNLGEFCSMVRVNRQTAFAWIDEGYLPIRNKIKGFLTIAYSDVAGMFEKPEQLLTLKEAAIVLGRKASALARLPKVLLPDNTCRIRQSTVFGLLPPQQHDKILEVIDPLEDIDVPDWLEPKEAAALIRISGTDIRTWPYHYLHYKRTKGGRRRYHSRDVCAVLDYRLEQVFTLYDVAQLYELPQRRITEWAYRSSLRAYHLPSGRWRTYWWVMEDIIAINDLGDPAIIIADILQRPSHG